MSIRAAVAWVVAVVWVFAAAAGGQIMPVTISNLSRTTACAEDRNVVFAFGGRPDRFTIRAMHPVYEVTEHGCEPILTGCPPAEPGFSFSPERLLLHENDQTQVEAIRDENWWRNRGMQARAGDRVLNVAHRIEIRRKIAETQAFAEVLTVYADGAVSLKPHPRAGTTPVCTGALLVVGPAQVFEGRHYAQIDRVTYEASTGSLALNYAGGGSATINLLAATRTNSFARVTISYDTRLRPFAALRSMHISSGVSDTARAQVLCGGEPMYNGPVLDVPDGVGDTFFFSRLTRSQHAQSAPNLRLTIETPARSLPDFNADGRTDLVFQDTVSGTIRIRHMNCLRTLSTLEADHPAPAGWRVAAMADFNRDRKADLLLRDTRGGGNVIWLMDGGTRMSIVTLPAVGDPQWVIAGTGNFGGDADGGADIVWRNRTTGQNVVWLMNRTTRVANLNLPTLTDIEWQIGGAGDFDGDGHADLLWRNCRTKQNVVWRMHGGQRLATEPIPTLSGAGWNVGDVLDLDGDGRAEVVWRNPISGENTVWFLWGPSLRESLPIEALNGPSWRLPGDSRAVFPMPDGDFDGDGSADVLFRNLTTGRNQLWRMRALSVLATVPLPGVTDTRWSLRAVQDLTNDHVPDLVWQNTTDGRLALWFMDGTRVRASLPLPQEPDLGWRVVGAGDFDGDGETDLVWRHSVSGNNRLWRMAGVNPLGPLNLPAQPNGAWQIQGVADFNLDGKADLLWRNLTTGDNALWLMDGAVRRGTVLLPPEADTQWSASAVRDYDRDGDPDILWRHGATGENKVWLMNRTVRDRVEPLPTVVGADVIIGG